MIILDCNNYKVLLVNKILKIVGMDLVTKKKKLKLIKIFLILLIINNIIHKS